MSRFFRVCITLLCLPFSAAPLPAQWISPTPQGNRIFTSALAGDRAFFLGQASTILRTDDAGLHWDLLPPYTDPIEHVMFANEKNQLIAFADSLHGYITATWTPRETSDGGRTWFTSTAPPGYGPIYFVSPRHGWIWGYGGCFRTTDGGSTWGSIPALAAPSNSVTGFAAADSAHVWLITPGFRGIRSSAIRYSSNGGVSWTTQPVDWGGMLDTARTSVLADIRVNSSGVGLASGFAWLPNRDVPDGFVLRTTNFGAAWRAVLTSRDIYRSILSPADSLWVLLGNNRYSQERGMAYEPSILRSADSGKSWTRVFSRPDLLAPETGVWIPSRRAMLAGGEGGVLYRSMDLGLTWEILGTGTPRIRDVALLPGTTIGIAPGDSSFVLRSTDGGASWRSGRVNAVGVKKFNTASAGGGRLWIGGEAGMLLRSDDHGSNWERVWLPYDTLRYGAYSIEDVSAYDSSNIAVCLAGLTWASDRSFIFSSSDGGNHWNAWQFPEGLQARSVHMHSPVGIAAGGLYWPPGKNTGEGFVAQSGDLGLHWDTTHLDAPVVKVASLSDLICLAGTYGGGYRTSDGGSSWQKLFPTNDMVSEIVFDGSGDGWLFRSYDMLKSSDEGATWLPAAIDLPSEYAVHAMAAGPDGEMFFVSVNGAFLASVPSVLFGSEDPGYHATYLQPLRFALAQNYPNPFNPATTIEYSLAFQGHVRLEVFNILGERVATLVDETRPAGHFVEKWNASKFPSGTYFYRLQLGAFAETKKLLLVR